MSGALVAGLAALALSAAAVALFNRLVRLRNRVRTAWADVDVQLARRHDLVPSLVAAVQGYAGHESALLQAVTALRARALELQGPGALSDVEAALGDAVARVLVLQEAYPDLRASDHFAQLQRDLVDTEEQLQFARRFYNGAVRDLNDAIQRVPDLLVARVAGFRAAPFFAAAPDTDAVPRVALPG